MTISAQVSVDGVYVTFTTQRGRTAVLNIEALAQSRGPLVGAILVEWCEDQRRLGDTAVAFKPSAPSKRRPHRK